MNKINIAIDGPASAGKSTVAKRIAKDLSYVYCDTGAMYRSLTLAALKKNIDLTDEQALKQLLDSLEIKFVYRPDGQLIFLNGEDVTSAIRTNEVTKNVSLVSSYKTIREKLVNQQREIAKKGGVVMDGRDIGTVVLPDAQVKIFLVASVEERAQRRYRENMERGIPGDLKQIEAAIQKRDLLDSTRENSPLVQAKDAVLLDTTGLSIDQVVEAIKKQVKNFKERKL